MSCASPISQLSPPSRRMYSANNLLSPCRASADDPPFSFAFSPSSSPKNPASSPAKARSVLTDIVLHRQKNSPQIPLGRAGTLPKCSKENWDSAGHSNAEQEASIDPLRSASVGRGKRRNVENDTSIFTLCSSPSPRQLTRTTAVHYTQLGSPNTTCGREHGRLNVRENGASIDGLCSSPSPSRPITAASANYTQLESPQTCGREELGAAVKLQKHGVESGAPNDPFCSSPSPSPLKRKRPAKLAIPEFARLASFGKAKQFELPPQEPLSSEIMSFEAPMFGVSCRKGRRESMEDAHTAITNFQGKANQAFFGVFDGHGGKSAAQFAAKNLGRHIAAAIQNQGGSKESLESAMHAGYLAIDSEFSEKGLDSGACSISAYLQEGHLVVANAGDCKAVLCRDGKAEALSNLHRASDAKERERIESLGGYVDCFNGVWRVQGTLAVTRGFGDTNLKKWISPEPEVRQLDITKGCEFLILASDGLWDKLSDQEVVDCAREVLQRGDEHASDSLTSRPNKVLRKHNDTSISIGVNIKKSEHTESVTVGACNKLIHKACSKGNLDDITVMVVPLENFAFSM